MGLARVFFACSAVAVERFGKVVTAEFAYSEVGFVGSTVAKDKSLVPHVFVPLMDRILKVV